jgi:hypothetical protein
MIESLNGLGLATGTCASDDDRDIQHAFSLAAMGTCAATTNRLTTTVAGAR